MHDLDWNDLRVVAVVARHPTLAAAAAELEIDPSTVWRRLRRLETTAGLALFERGGRSTAAGAALLEHAARVEAEVLALSRTLEGQDQGPEGRVRLTLPETLLGLAAPIVGRVLDACPGLAVEVDTSSRALDLDRNEAHVALRATLEPPESAIARRVGPLAWGVYAREGASPRWIAYTDARSNVPAVRRWRERETVAALEVDTVAAMRRALDAGLGRGLLPAYLADGLVAVEPPDARDATALWVLYHPDHRRSRRVRVLADALVAGLAPG